MQTAWILAGATATGKTAAAQILAERSGCALLSADAMLVYRGMDIGTAKPTPAERRGVPYYGLDLASPAEPFSTGLWLADAARALSACGWRAPRIRPAPHRRRRPRPLHQSLTDGLDGAAAHPETRARWQALLGAKGRTACVAPSKARSPGALAELADPSNPAAPHPRARAHLEDRGSLPAQWKRSAPAAPIAVLRLPRSSSTPASRAASPPCSGEGLVEEVRALRAAYPRWSPTAAQAIGCAEGALLDGTLSQAEAAERIIVTRQLAKRQETWFRHQSWAVWLEIDDNDPPERVAQRVLDTWRQHGPTPVLCP